MTIERLGRMGAAGHPPLRRRAGLLLSGSLVTLVTALGVHAVRAQSVGALMAAANHAAVVATTTVPKTSPSSSPSMSGSMATAAANALRYQTQLNSAVNLAQQAQAAAQAAAAKLDQNLMGGIVDGLGDTGLKAAVTQVTTAAADPTGLKTWQGANLPTASALDPNQVTVVQTDQRAVLSWTSFNVGQHTTLTFQQQKNGVAQPGWVALNRVVGVLDPATGLPKASSVAPSQILGSIKADGTVLVLNQNGILFGPTSQVNVGSLVATSLEIGRASATATSGVQTIAQRDAEFLNYGILGYSESNAFPAYPNYELSAQVVGADRFGGLLYDASGPVTVQAGGSLTSASGGYLMLAAPKVSNAGQLTASDGEVALQSGNLITLRASTGSATSADPNVRGLVLGGVAAVGAAPDSVTDSGLIQSTRGYVSIGATSKGSVTEGGVVGATTSVSESGYINLNGPTITVLPNATIAITPDSGTATLPQDSTSLSLFQPSRIRIGGYQPNAYNSDGSAITTVSTTPAKIDIGANSLIYAPGATISIGADAGEQLATFTPGTPLTGVTVESGAVIDAAGLTDVLVPASRNSIKISPVLGNELANSPAFRNGFLSGATVYLDPRLSGVNANGVAWVGSPLISAAAYAQQVGVSVSELMIKGGNITLGASPVVAGSTLVNTPRVDVRPGATIDISGGWRTYQAGQVQQTYIVDTTGAVIPISQANPNGAYIGIYNGYTVNQSRWGVSQTYAQPLLTGAYTQGQYSEGQDAGSLTLSGSLATLDGQFNASAFTGPAQIVAATTGTATTSVYGDTRKLQGAPSQLPTGGYLDVGALGPGQSTLGADIEIVGADAYASGVTDTITLNADALSGAGLGQLTVQTSGKISLAADANITLTPGAVFTAVAGRAITLDGVISAPSGSISVTTLGGRAFGSALIDEPVAPGFADITVNGQLNVAGVWSNDFNVPTGQATGPAYLNGGKITLNSAAQQTLYPVTGAGAGVLVNVDVSGSILINAGSRLDLSGGGYVNGQRALTLTAKGGDLSLIDKTDFFNIVGGNASSANNPSFAIIDPSAGLNTINFLPAVMTSRVSIADGAILDAGFGGGGTFSLTTPSFSLGAAGSSSIVSNACGSGGMACGAVLPVDFFSRSGFANYVVTSNGTRLIQTVFDSGKGQYSGLLATQVAEVAKGQTLSLNQSYFSPILSATQVTALRTLSTGSSLYSVLTPTAPTDAWDQKAVSLTLDGLLELRVDAGASVIGAPKSSLSVSELYNQGLIRLPGGTITQSESNYKSSYSVGVHALSDVFGTALADGSYSQTATNTYFAGLFPSTDPHTALSNQQVASNTALDPTPIYFLGDLGAGEAVRLSAGSVTDLSGAAIVNPRATPSAPLAGGGFTDGTVIAGGALTANGVVGGYAKTANLQTGSILNLSGTSATFDRPTIGATTYGGISTTSEQPTQVWSNGGNLTLNEGGTLTGALVTAQGGAPLALGGVISLFDPVLDQTDPAAPTLNAVSATAVTQAGFSTFVAQGALTSVGDVTLTLPRSVFVESAATASSLNATAPTIGSGGALTISAPYIALDSQTQAVSTVATGAIASHTLTLNAGALDITGGVLIDQSVGAATLNVTGDLRLIGVAPNASQTQQTLIGQLAANGDITVNAAQTYPTTGSSFTLSTTGVSSAAASKGGAIIFNAVGATPDTPYSAGGSLTVLAANITQNGVVRAPLGSLTLGSDTASANAPATVALTLKPGSTTSVSADGLNIPYGATTDQVEWYFAPTQSAALSAPPAGVLHLAGGTITAAAGAKVNLAGGGDVYAYEFVPGTGGSRDVLSRFNSDSFSSNNGYQYPDGRQVYAIVPGLSKAQVAALDPIYASDYSALYGPTQAGTNVYLNAAPGLAAGWYTLLPAKYALLPGGMRVVQDTGAATPAVNAAGVGQSTVLSDGTIVTPGYFGVSGVNTRGATPVVFDVQNQTTILNESKIALTTGNRYFSNLAATKGTSVPQLPIDAGRLIISPQVGLTLASTFLTTPAKVVGSAGQSTLIGRGSEVDISGTTLLIDDPANPVTAPAGTIEISDTTLSSLGASSLFLGGIRTDNADGTTSLLVSSNAITVESGATLSAPEIFMAVDGAKSKLVVNNGAAIIATGAVTNESSGAYVIDGLSGGERVQEGQGGFLRVSNGPERFLTRLNATTKSPGTIAIGPKKPAGSAVKISGAAVEFDAVGALTMASNIKLTTTSLALASNGITFGTKGTGLLVTPQLQATLAQIQNLTLKSQKAINFSTGTYSFNTLTLDTPGLLAVKSGAVAVKAAGTLTLTSTNAALKGCDSTTALACGTGTLGFSAATIGFGTGTIQTYGAGGGVTLNATSGVLAQGAATFNVAGAPLTVNSPFIGDKGSGTVKSTQPSLTLVSTGAVAIASATPASQLTTAPAGAPGASLTINGASVSVVGTALRATAGKLTIAAANGIAVSGGAVIATPSYSKTFGDAADTTTVSAPGGLLALNTTTGDIAISDDSRLAVGGTSGTAGTLSLQAGAGAVYAYHGASTSPVSLATVLSAQGGGGSLTFNATGAFDLAAFAAGNGQQFNGAISIRSGAGDLTLAAGDMIKAASVSLTADGGRIEDSGQISTSGVNGGDIALYGVNGVHLAATARIDAQASGYGAKSTKQAHGGAVTLGVDGTGAIAVDQGAVVDVSAQNTDNRLVNLNRNNGTDYTFVADDVGGSLTLRAPVVLQSGAETVNVSVGGAVQGASSVVLQGFRRFNLADLAANPNYTGVTIAGGVASLDLAASGTGLVNALADPSGPVVQFVQGFDVSRVYGALGGLAGQANFHARPGVELDYTGGVTLNSNWNLGAGTVDIPGAVAAGLMAPDSGLPGQYAVVGADAATRAANEGQILANYTQATYRVGGRFQGESGALTVRAGGALTLNGSITDGFFQFADQTDPNYLNQVLGGGNRTYQASLTPTTDGDTVSIVFPNAADFNAPNGQSVAASYVLPYAPYSAAANSAAALGDAAVAGGALVTGTGDPLGSAQLFPLLPSAKGGTTQVSSWSYQLVAGAALNAPGGSTFQPSVNPMTVVPGQASNVTVLGQHVYGYKPVTGTRTYNASLDLQDNGVSYAPTDWLANFIADKSLSADGSTTTTIEAATGPVRTALAGLVTAFEATGAPQDAITVSSRGVITTSLREATLFMDYVSRHFDQLASLYPAPNEAGIGAHPVYATAPTLIRTGTGNIAIAASGAIDLRNGDQTVDPKTGLPTQAALKLAVGGVLAVARGDNLQLGGAAVYTAGALAQLGVTKATDVATGLTLTVDLGATAKAPTDNLANQSTPYSLANGNTGGVVGAYTYGGGNDDNGIKNGYIGVLIADPVYSDHGGDVSLTAGTDVLGRRNTVLASELGGYGYVFPQSTSTGLQVLPSWVGVGDQPWRTGSIGSVVNVQLNAQLFNEGLGALGGGDISVRAGGAVSDLSMVANDSITTAAVGAGASGGQAIVNLGQGSVSVIANGAILGGRVDVASGDAVLNAGGAVSAAGTVNVETAANTFVSISNDLRLRLSNGTVSVVAGGAATVESIGALGISNNDSGAASQGFYEAGSGVSILANGAVDVTNAGLENGLIPAPAAGPAIVYPGSFSAVSLSGGVNANAGASTQPVLLYPDATGTLTLLAGGDIASAVIAQLDSDPTLLPGAFSQLTPNIAGGLSNILTFAFPTVLPTTPDAILRELHNPSITHAGDSTPNRIVAGGDITSLTLSTAKQTRVAAGRDVTNMVLLGQNVDAGDVTRVTATRDIVGSTALNAVGQSASPLPTVQGNTFEIGGPGALFIEAGRNAGPFLTSVVTNTFVNNTLTGPQTYSGGIITLGNQWNLWLPAQSANIYTEFGVAPGQNFTGLVSAYLTPTNFASQPGYLFLQSTDANGIITADRTKQVYSLSLVDWMKSIAPEVITRYETATGVKTPPANAPAYIQFLESLQAGHSATTAQALTYLPNLSGQIMPLIPWLQLHDPALLTKTYGTLDVTYDQAFATFQSLSPLIQRQFLISDVYFNELIQTSIPSSPSYLTYSRGYIAVNTLFPASSGYTANNLSGGLAGASTTVQTGNLDLRLSTIQTDQGGDIAILGPGGRVLAGSVVSTSVQAATRNYAGVELLQGQTIQSKQASSISSIPPGSEGILTLKGGSIASFTDQDFLLNQSRAFSEQGGDVAIWSSNADVNAGQGPRTTADVSPAVVHIDENAYAVVDTAAAVSGAGIGAFGADANSLAPDVFLIAPRGAVDAGAAGVRSSGNVFIAAFQVSNAAGIQAQGTVSGAGGPAAVNVSAQTGGDASASAAAQAAQAAGAAGDQEGRPLIYVDVLGFLPDEPDVCSPQDRQEGKCK